MRTALTDRFSQRGRTLAVAAFLLAAALPSPAKTIDYTPDFTEGATWDTHHILAVRVTATGRDDRDRAYLIYRVENQLSAGPVDQVRTVPVSDLWFGRDDDGRTATAPIEANDRLLLAYAKEGPSPIAAFPVADARSADTWNAVQQIAQLRTHPDDPQAAIAAALSANPIVSRYALQHLLGQPPSQFPQTFAANLLLLRDDQALSVPQRILAARLSAKLAGNGNTDFSDAEYSWLQNALAASQRTAWTALRPFADRLLQFAAKRPQSVEFFARLALNSTAAEPVRIAAYSVLDDARVFQYESPDALSDRIFDACEQLLKDTSSAMRGAGAALLHNISMRMNPVHRRAYVQRSMAALSTALTTEVDDATREQLAYFHGLVSQ
jgi:hypothetical protein